jgi:hypothetical protein
MLSVLMYNVMYSVRDVHWKVVHCRFSPTGLFGGLYLNSA